jgi:uncharacterized protein YprB with RNaseH-like and TPR domain
MRFPGVEYPGQSPLPAQHRLLADGGRQVGSPTLPPPDATPARLLALSGAVVGGYHRETMLALVDSTAPDALVATPPAAGSVVPALARAVDHPVLHPGRGVRPDVTACQDGIVVAGAAGGDAPLAPDAVDAALSDNSHDGPDSVQTAKHRCLVTDALSLSVDPYRRETTLDGVAAYAQSLPEPLRSDATHLSTALRPGFQTEAELGGDSLSVVGIGDSEATLGVGREEGETTAAVVEVYPNGAVDTAELDPGTFGLRGVDQVGHRRAESLRGAGISSPADLADARASDLAELEGFGRATADTVRAAATARATGTVVPTGDDPLPRGDPVFVDIETDGLNPSTAWLVGVLDGGPADGTYLAFREQRPGDGAHLEAFMTWLTGTGAGRPVVAWHGYGFDFPVIREQLRQHCPERVPDWDDRYCFDALYWAREKNGGNAALPGRTNELAAVATALGWEPATSGLDGETVAQSYVAWRNRLDRADSPATVAEPDWERLEAYCEDDVRALATIYDALREAARREPETTTPPGEESTQGALSDFS